MKTVADILPGKIEKWLKNGGYLFPEFRNTTHIKELDEHNVYVYKGNLLCVAGLNQENRSALSLKHIAKALCDGKKVVYLTFSKTAEEVATMAFKYAMEIDKDVKLDNLEVLGALGGYGARLEEVLIRLLSQNKKLDELGYDICVIDDLRSLDKTSNGVLGIEGITRSLKRAARITSTYIIVEHTLKKNPQRLIDCDGIELDADAILKIYKDNVTIAKNRHGKAGIEFKANL